MAHELEMRDNEGQMFSVGETPWHRLGKVIQEAPTIEEGIKLAGLDWKVRMEDLFLADNRAVSNKAVVREDTNKILGVVGKNWTPLQNIDAFNFFDRFIESKEITLETAGSLRMGKQVWILGKINRPDYDILPNDPISRYVLLSDNKSGTGQNRGVKLGFTNVRVVCNNTLTASVNSNASKLISIKHSKNVKQNLENIGDVMKLADAEFVASMEQMRMLTRKDINQKDIADYVRLNFFDAKDLTQIAKSSRSMSRFNGMCDTFEELIETGLGSDLKNVKGTVWSLYNAGTEFLTHYDKKNDDDRLYALWYGQNNKKLDNLLTTALEMVG
jgi:phage/plasmid-like protein (TIGR03299 family)